MDGAGDDGGDADLFDASTINGADPDETDGEASGTATERLHSMGYNTDGESGTGPDRDDSTASGTAGFRADAVRVLLAVFAALVALAVLRFALLGFLDIWMG